MFKKRQKKELEKVGHSISNTAYVLIDHPKENEVITHPQYSIRISASKATTVEISIEGGGWQPCYYSNGYWWFNWGNYSPVTHTIVARLKGEDGKIFKLSQPRKCLCKV